MKRAIFLRLIRVQNLPTALADVIAGFVVASSGYGLSERGALALVASALAGALLYSGGMANNDAQHATKDALLRKPRPVADGSIEAHEARWTSVVLLVSGIAAALAASPISAMLACGIALFALIYNRLARGSVRDGAYAAPKAASNALGAVLLACCRVFNVALGMTAALGVSGTDSMAYPTAGQYWMLASVFAYFLVVIGVSLLEDFGGGVRLLRAMDCAAIVSIGIGPLTARWIEAGSVKPDADIVMALVLSAVLAALVHIRFRAAIANPQPAMVGKIVRWGIVGEPIFLGAFVAAMVGWEFGLLVAALMPVCLALSRTSHST